MKTKIFVFGIIIILGAFLRLFVLDKVPPSLNWDEVSHGYNAYSIITTGKDEWGARFPLTAFRAFGDYKLPLYIYLTAPLTIFGLSEWTVRLVSAISGIGAVIFIFFVVQKLFNNFALSGKVLLRSTATILWPFPRAKTISVRCLDKQTIRCSFLSADSERPNLPQEIMNNRQTGTSSIFFMHFDLSEGRCYHHPSPGYQKIYFRFTPAK